MPSERGKEKAVVPAKISPPRLVEAYRRARLFRALDAGRRKRAVWIAAPAGAGKTFVVATYLRARRLPALWYNVDSRDADVANLFHFLKDAAHLAAPRRKTQIPAFKNENQAGVAAFARAFFETLARERPSPSAIVIDDYHEANSDLWDQVIREGICALPKNQCIVVVSRGEPPPSFSKLLVGGEIATVGPEELRFTPREMTGLVYFSRPDLRDKRARSRVERVCELADGWAAALTLLLQEGDIAALPDGVEYRSARLFDYFASEILEKLAPRQREFLLKTSIAPSFDASLAEDLTGFADAAQILVNLERRGFLTQRLGTSGAYRYHRLLGEFLLRRAERELGSDVLRGLHRRAAESLVKAGLIDEAMEQLENARDTALRAQLIVQAAPSYLAAGRSRTVERWIARLPPECVEQDGWLGYWGALACLDHAPSRARDWLEGAYNHFERTKDTAGLYSSSAAAIQATVHEGMVFKRLDPWVERLEHLRREGPPCPDPLAPMVATGMLMASTFRRREPAEGRRYWADQAMTLMMKSHDPGHRMMTGGLLAFYVALHDDAARASAILEMLRGAAHAAELSPLSVLTVLLADALCAWVRGQDGSCIARVREALELASRTGIYAWNVYLETIGVAAALGTDDLASAGEFLERLAEAAQTGVPFLVGAYYFNASWEALARGDVARALHSAELSCENAELLGYPVAHCISNLVRADALFQSGRASEAVRALDVARGHASDIGSSYLTHGCDLVGADFLWESDREQAKVLLRRGMETARARNYQNMFCMSKALMARNAERALEHRIEPSHAIESIALHRLTLDRAPVHLDAWPWRYRLRALGRFEIESGDRDHASKAGEGSVPRGMPLRLLCAIIALGGRAVSDVALIDTLWPDADGDAGRRVFDTTLHRLRRQLGDGHVLRLQQGRVGLDERLCWLDTWTAEHLFAESKRLIEGSAPLSDLLEVSSRLLEVCRGALLVSETGTWVRGPRERYATKFEHAASELGGAFEVHGEFGQASLLYLRMLEGNPLVERAYAGLMRCELAAGRPAEATKWFKECETKLATMLQTSPGRELMKLRAKVQA